MSENIESTKVYKVPSDNLGVLAAKFKKLARRATKLGLPAPTYTEVGEPVRRQRKDEITGLVTKTWLEHQIVVDPGCTEVKVQGWTFIATIQHTEEGNIIRAVGNAEVPHKYRNVTQLCEHCNTNRNRKDTYILKHEEGETKQVGRNCLADFFGHDALMYAERAQYLSDIDAFGESMEDEFGFGGGGGPKYEPLEEFLAYVAECIKLDGWMSRGKAREMSEQLCCNINATCDIAYKHLHRRLAGQGFKFLFTTPSLESVELSANAIEWASEIEGEDVPDYIHNIRTIARRGVYENRDMGMAASIVSAYQRHLSKLRWLEIQAKRKEIAQYVGNVGDKIRVKLMVEKVIQCHGGFGSNLHIMSNDDGNVFIWFSSGDTYETGKEVLLQGTVKGHNERDGIKQTILTRCSEVVLKKYYTFINGEIHKFECASEAEVKKALREKLGIKKLPNGTKIIEDIPQEVSDEKVAV